MERKRSLDTRINVQVPSSSTNRTSLSNLSLNSCDQTDSRVYLRRKLSLAQSFSQRVVTESPFLDPRESESSWGPSVGQRSALDLEYKEKSERDLGTAPEEDVLDGARKLKRENMRAQLGRMKLLWYDFKVSYRRWRYKNWYNPFLRDYLNTIERNFGSGIGSLFLFSRWLIMLNIFLILIWISFVVTPLAINFDYSTIKSEFAYRNLLDGQGPVAKSWVFYCSYPPNILAKGGIFPDFYYHVGLAYLSMILLTFFGSLFIILRNMAIAQHPSTSASLSKRYCFSFLMWTSWDYSITSSDAASNLRKGIISALQDNMYQAKAELLSTVRTRKDKCIIVLRRMLAWILTLILVGGGCTGITFLVLHVNFSPPDHSLINDINIQGIDVTASPNMMQVYVTPIVFSLINMLVPLVLTKIPMLEKYETGQVELNVTIARIYLLRMANFFALIMSLYGMTLQSSNNLEVSGVCTGTMIGQEIYKLIIMDTLIQTSAKLLVSFGLYFWKREKKEFDIPSAILVLIYRQALIWFGTLVCPVLPIVGALSNVIFFFTTYIVIKFTCKPPIKRWRQTRRTFFFMSVLLLTLLFIIVPVSVIIGSQTVNLGSTSNPAVFEGPFTGEYIPTSVYHTFASSLPVDWIKKCLLWLISNTVVLPLVLILVSLLSYLKMRINGEKKHCLILQAELQQEREDNKKLVRKLQETKFLGYN